MKHQVRCAKCSLILGKVNMTKEQKDLQQGAKILVLCDECYAQFLHKFDL